MQLKLVLLAFILTGCSSEHPIADATAGLGRGVLALGTGGISEYQRAQAEKQPAIDDAKCQSFGAAKGTPDYIKCRTTLEAARLSAPTVINHAAPAASHEMNCQSDLMGGMHCQ